MHWFEAAPGLPNDKEILLYAILVVYTRTSVADLNSWVSEVRRQRATFVSQGAAGLPADWGGFGSPPSKTFQIWCFWC